MEITRNKTPKYLVDMTRTLSRIGRGFATGIDRVEIEYIKHCAELNPDNLFVAKIGRDYALLNAGTALEILDRMEINLGWGVPGLLDVLRLKLNWEQRCARSFARRRAIRTAPLGVPSRLFKSTDLSEYEYLNVGHSNLTDGFLETLKSCGCKTIRVLIHDMIPLDHPEYSQAHIPRIFEERMRAVATYADQIICNSEETCKRASSYFTSWGAKLEYVVSHLGTEPMSPTGNRLRLANKKYYVVLGTIEPRKNHLLLFRVWERLASDLAEQDVPDLYVVGRRGWNNKEAFQFLDESALVDRCIFEKSDLNDSDLADLLAGAEALLFPSFVEGFGLPALEAAQLGVPVICSDLSTFRENLGDYGCYLDPHSPEAWEEVILKQHTTSDMRRTSGWVGKAKFRPPTWDAHFRHVFG